MLIYLNYDKLVIYKLNSISRLSFVIFCLFILNQGSCLYFHLDKTNLKMSAIDFTSAHLSKVSILKLVLSSVVTSVFIPLSQDKRRS